MHMIGIAATMISLMVTLDGVTPFITKSNSPKGGVITPISITKRAMMQNHKGSNPNTRAIGMKMGIEIIMIET